METEKQTETEQLEDKTEEVETDKQAEEKAQKQNEEILSEEELEIQREIEAYKTKIEEIDAKIAEFETKKVDDLKREAMRKWCYTDEQINRYIGYIDGETREEIERSIAELAQDIPPAGDNFADPSPFNGVKQKPAAADPSEIGKTLFERIKNKIWGGGVFL